MAGFHDENYENLLYQAQCLPEAPRRMMGGGERQPEPALPVLQPLQERNRPEAPLNDLDQESAEFFVSPALGKKPSSSSTTETPRREPTHPTSPSLEPSTPSSDRNGKHNYSQKKKGKAIFTLITWLGLLNARVPVPLYMLFRFVEEYFPGCIIRETWRSSLNQAVSRNPHLFVKSKFGYWTIKKGSRQFITGWLRSKSTSDQVNINNLGLANTDDWKAILSGTKGLPQGVPEEFCRIPEKPLSEGPTGHEQGNQYVACEPTVDGVIYAEDQRRFVVSQPPPVPVEREQPEMQLQEAFEPAWSVQEMNRPEDGFPLVYVDQESVEGFVSPPPALGVGRSPMERPCRGRTLEDHRPYYATSPSLGRSTPPSSVRHLKKGRRNYNRRSGGKKGRATYILLTWLGLLNAQVPVPIRRIYRFVKEYFPGCITPGTDSWENSLRECATRTMEKPLFLKLEPAIEEGLISSGKRISNYYTITEGSREIIDAMLEKMARRNINVYNMGLANPDDWGEILAGTKGLPEEDSKGTPEELHSLQIGVPEEPSYEVPTGYEQGNQYVECEPSADGVFYAEDQRRFVVSQPPPAQVERQQPEMQLQEAIPPHYVDQEPLPSYEHLPEYDPWDQCDALEQYGDSDDQDLFPLSHSPEGQDFGHQQSSSAEEEYNPFETNEYNPFDTNDYTPL